MKHLQPTDVLVHYQNPKRKRAIHHILTTQAGIIQNCTTVEDAAEEIANATSNNATSEQELAEEVGEEEVAPTTAATKEAAEAATDDGSFYYYCLKNETLLRCSNMTGKCEVDEDIG